MQHSRLLLISILFLFFLPVFSFADSSYIFSTDSQSVDVGVMSSKINIQASAPVIETTYLVLTSSSATGQFLTSSGNPQTSAVYISTGDSNRGVYYKDSTAGDFIITAVVQNKAKTSTIATISQHIFIGQPVSAGSASSTSTTTSNTATTTNVSTSDVETSSLNITSAHSSPAPISDMEEKLEFEISAGRDRLTEVGSSVLFRAVPTKFDKIPELGITYMWSFGDGTVGQGNNINHTYKFAGEYSVVVNASYSDKQAVSRLSVRVISPDVSLSKVSGGVQINNNSKTEINLEGWSLIRNKKTFVFPMDTLIPSLKKIVFSDDVTGMTDGNIELLNPLGKQFANFIPEIPRATTAQSATTSTVISFADIQAKLDDVKNKLTQIAPKPEVKLASIINTSVEPKIEPKKQISTSSSSELSNTAIVFEASKQSGVVSSIFSWPIKGFNFIKHLFTEE